MKKPGAFLLAGYTGVSLLVATACGGAAEDQNGDGDSVDESSGGALGDGDVAAGGSNTGGMSSGGLGSGGLGSGGLNSGGESTGGGTSGGGSPSGGTDAGGSGSGGQDVGSGGQGTGGNTSCAVVSAGPLLARRAQSAGFSGTDAEYSELYSQPCAVESDCEAPCVERGGTEAFCSTHVCIDSEEDYCLPPTKWRLLPGALTVGASIDDAAVTSLSLSNGDDHDLLLLDDFGFEIPENATVLGILATIRKAKGATDLATDSVVKLLRNGVLGAADYAQADEWPTELTDIEYGGEDDIWNEPWAPADINNPAFGLAIAALPGESTGRAYVDAASLTVYYQPYCP